MRKAIFFFLLVTSTFNLCFAQGIKRQVLGSIGVFGKGNGIMVNTTFGQPPNAGTIKDSSNYLRQGFQQPICLYAPKAEILTTTLTSQCLSNNSFDFIYPDSTDGFTNFEWIFGADASSIKSNLKNPTGITFSNTGTKNIELLVSRGGCRSSAIYSINVYDINVGSSINFASCDSCNGRIEINNITAVAPYTILWNTGDTTEIITGLCTGNYIYELTDSNGCQKSDTVELLSSSTLELGTITIVKPNCDDAGNGSIIVEVSGGSTPYDIAWSNGSLGNTLNNINAGTYNISVTDNDNCLLQDSVSITSETGKICNKEFVIYNVISPNDDGKNDVWIIEGIENFPDNEVKIFNRWGSIVYEKSSYSNTWNGLNNEGEPLPSATYYYMLKLNDAENRTYSGDISVIR
jgi:gliding motility-associated-like protein